MVTWSFQDVVKSTTTKVRISATPLSSVSTDMNIAIEKKDLPLKEPGTKSHRQARWYVEGETR